jgi:glyoxylase I family protein
MERVTGIGGLLFRARDPAALARWYADHLGINPVPGNYEERPWWQQQGPTAFSPFPADTDAFGRPEQAGSQPRTRSRSLPTATADPLADPTG